MVRTSGNRSKASPTVASAAGMNAGPADCDRTMYLGLAPSGSSLRQQWERRKQQVAGHRTVHNLRTAVERKALIGTGTEI